MFLAALALAVHLVQPGDTLSGIAASHGVSLASVEAANPQITNYDLIYAGQRINLPGGVRFTHSQPSFGSSQPSSSSAGSSSTSSHSRSSSSPSSISSAGYSSPDLADIPGVPRSFAACVAFRESTNGTNQAYNGGVYGIITASGINVNGQSLAAQKAAFAKLYAQYGTSPWSPSDHC